MKNQANVWMAVLTFTALVLSIIFVTHTNQPRADAAMLNAQSSFSLMTSGTVGGDEALVIIDKASQKMLILYVNGNNLEVVAGTNFR